MWCTSNWIYTFFNKMVELGIEPSHAAKPSQYGWETITEALKHGGITNMMHRLSNPAKIEAIAIRRLKANNETFISSSYG